jgi:Phage tail assembly chaperone protein
MSLVWYTSFDNATKRIVSVFNSSSLEIAQLNSPPNTFLVQGFFSQDEYYLNQSNEPEQLPQKLPYNFCTFDPATASWIDNQEQAWDHARKERTVLLQESDWTDTASAPQRLGSELYNSWQNYRQALRDITQQLDPFRLVWPIKPGETVPVYPPIKPLVSSSIPSTSL